MTTCEFFFSPQNMATFSFFSLNKSFVVLALSYLKISAKIRQNKKKKTASPSPPFFFSNLQMAKFCRTKNNTASRAARERRRTRRGIRVRRFVFWWENFISWRFADSDRDFASRGSVVRVKEIKQPGFSRNFERRKNELRSNSCMRVVKTILVLIVWKFLPKQIWVRISFLKQILVRILWQTIFFSSCNELLVGWLQLWVPEEDRELDDSGRSNGEWS